MDLSDGQRAELARVARHGEPGYVRTKALVVLNRADGRSVSDLAGVFRVSRQAIYEWQRRYERSGIGSLWVQPGRGRKGRADLKELERYVRQSPRNFGIARRRWTLESLAGVVPSLRGFSAFGVQKALIRAGYRYKRGQPHIHSPDPQYEGKKGLWTRR